MRRRALEQDFEETIRDQYGAKFYEMICNLLREDNSELNLETSSEESKKLLRVKEDRLFSNAVKVKKGVNLMKIEGESKLTTRSIYANLKKVSPNDLRGIILGERLKDNLINLYFKILEKINLILQAAKYSQ